MKSERSVSLAALCCATLGMAGAVLLSAQASGPTIEFSPDPESVVLEYTHLHHMMARPDPEPLMRIYADGRVRVHYALYMAKAGDYEFKLTAAELEQLFVGLADDGLIDLDLHAAREERQLREKEARESGELRHVSDITETLIDLRLESYRAAAAEQAVSGMEKSLRWPNVYADARWYKSFEAVQTLAKAEERLQKLLERSDLKKLN